MSREDAGPRVVIAVATYRRPDLLAGLLASLEDCDASVELRVVVVDNDAQATGRAAAEASGLPLTYVVEPVAGIAQARNRALDELTEQDDAVVFVDDDERVRHVWLDSLVEGWRREGTEIVTGPVISVFAADCPRWIVEGGFIQRARYASGTRMPVAATNNTLLALEAWRRAGSPRFDEAFSETGGSDTEFFGRLHDAGFEIAWIDDAVVEEDVPSSRANLRWIWRRAVRGGNVQARLRLRRTPSWRLLARVVVVLPYRAARLVVGLVRDRRLLERHLVPFAWQVGLLGGVAGKSIREYRR